MENLYNTGNYLEKNTGKTAGQYRKVFRYGRGNWV